LGLSLRDLVFIRQIQLQSLQLLHQSN
jgi:hypothetical protein